MELQFNLSTFNACGTQVHKAKQLMDVQYPIVGTLEIFWTPYHIFRQFKGYFITLPKPRRNAIPSLGHMTIPFSRYPKNTLGSITYLFTCEGVMHSPTKTQKDLNTLTGLHCKHYMLNDFGLGYQKGIVHAQKDSMSMHYPSISIRKIHWFHNIFLDMWRGITQPYQNL